jgi:hypothetical protein
MKKKKIVVRKKKKTSTEEAVDVLKKIAIVQEKSLIKEESVLTRALKLFNLDYADNLTAIQKLNLCSSFAEKPNFAEMFIVLDHDQRVLFVETNKKM